MLDLLGLGARDARRCPAAALAAALRGAALQDEPTFAESLVPLVHYGWSDLRALRDGPLEVHPGAAAGAVRPDAAIPASGGTWRIAEPARARALRAGLEQRLRARSRRARSAVGAASVPPDLLEKLGALGMSVPAAPSATEPPAPTRRTRSRSTRPSTR